MNLATSNQTIPLTQGYTPEKSPAAVLQAMVGRFRPISLAEMEPAALLNRVDTKFLFSTAQVIDVLGRLCFDYRILAINECRIHHYRSLYFDTHAFDLYHAHVTGRADIYKVRAREYCDTGTSYLEVKHKDHKRRTQKSRMPVAQCSGCLDEAMQAFVQECLFMPAAPLEPKLKNTFSRITLVSNSMLERVTIDLDLTFTDGLRQVNLEGIVVAEVKQELFSRNSAFLEAMRRLGLRKMGFSKYCYGVASLAAGVKRNTQKARTRMIQKIQSGEYHHDLIA